MPSTSTEKEQEQVKQSALTYLRTWGGNPSPPSLPTLFPDLPANWPTNRITRPSHRGRDANYFSPRPSCTAPPPPLPSSPPRQLFPKSLRLHH